MARVADPWASDSAYLTLLGSTERSMVLAKPPQLEDLSAQ
jgi:hypothetical protein